MAPTPGFVAVKTASGVQTLPPDEAARLIVDGLASEATEEDIRRGYFRDDAAMGAILGAARGASIGLSDVALAKSGALDPSDIKEYKEENPWASGLGEFGGAAASMLLPGGGLVGGVARAGRAAGGALSKLPLLGRLAPAAAEGAALGAAYGASEAAWDPDKKAKDILTSAAWGGAVGAGFGAVGLGVGRLAKWGRKEVQDEAASLSGAYEDALTTAKNKAEIAKLRGEQQNIQKHALGDESPGNILDDASLASGKAKRDELTFRRADKKRELDEIEAAAWGKPVPVAEEAVPVDPGLLRRRLDLQYDKQRLTGEAKKLKEAADGLTPASPLPLDAAGTDRALLDLGQLKKQLATDREVAGNLGDDLFGSTADPTRAMSPELYAAKREADAVLDDAIKEASSTVNQIERKIIRPLKAPKGDLTKINADLLENELGIGEIKSKWRGYEIEQKKGPSAATKLKIAEGQVRTGITYRELVDDQTRLHEAALRLRRFAKAEALAKDPAARSQKMLEYVEATLEEVNLRARRAGVTKQLGADLKSRTAAEEAASIAARSPAERAELEQRFIQAQRATTEGSERIKALEEQLKIRPTAPPLDPAEAGKQLNALLPKIDALEQELAAVNKQIRPKAPAAPARLPLSPQEAMSKQPLARAELDAVEAELAGARKLVADHEAAVATMRERAALAADGGPEARWLANEARLRELDALTAPVEKAVAAKVGLATKLGSSALARTVAGGIAGTFAGGPLGGVVGSTIAWMIAPKVANSLMGAVSGKAAPALGGVLGKIGKAATAGLKIGRPLKLPAITMTASEFADLHTEMQQVDPGQVEAEAWAALPSDMDPSIAGKVVGDAVGRLQFLKDKMPSPRVTLGGVEPPSQDQLDKFARYIRATVDSNSVYHDFAKGIEGEGPGISKEAIEVAELLDAEDLQRSREVVRSMLWRRESSTVSQQLQFSTFLGQQDVKSTVLQPYTAMAMNRLREEAPQPTRAPGRPSRIAGRHQTPLERIESGEKA